jgi:SAM-dependent methyltransferase
VSGPFDAIAPAYASLWSSAPEGSAQRRQVWEYIDPLFRSSARVLDLGCGIGDDALHLSQMGVDVHAMDASEKMVEIARSRGVDARRLAIESLGEIDGAYSGALSNFGALNCVRRLEPVAGDLAKLLAPGAPLAICVMGRFCWRETVASLLKGDFVRAVRRWKGQARWRGIEVRYWSARQIRIAFAPQFQIIRRIPIGGGDHQLYILSRRNPC